MYKYTSALGSDTPAQHICGVNLVCFDHNNFHLLQQPPPQYLLHLGSPGYVPAVGTDIASAAVSYLRGSAANAPEPLNGIVVWQESNLQLCLLTDFVWL